MLSSSRLVLLQYGLDPNMDKELEDINNCSIKAVIREITKKDLNILAQFMEFPVNRNGEINIGGARKILEKFLINQALPS